MPITEQEFSDMFQGIEMGDSTNALYLLRSKTEDNAVTFDGASITPELIRERYEKYDIYWKHKFSKTDQKYINKADRKKTLYDFLLDRMYNNTYKIEEHPRDMYLFGDPIKFPREDMFIKTKEFIRNVRTKETKKTS